MLSVSPFAFSKDTHSISLGFNVPLLYETAEYQDTASEGITRAWGLSISSYSFWNDWKWGLMYSGSIDYPMSIIAGGSVISTEDMKLNLMMNLIVGIAFRSSPDDRLQFYGGIGGHLMNYSGLKEPESRNLSLSSFNAGLGVEAAGKLNFSEHFFLLMGTSVIYDFYKTSTVGDDRIFSFILYDRYTCIILKPKLEMGFQYFRF